MDEHECIYICICVYIVCACRNIVVMCMMCAGEYIKHEWIPLQVKVIVLHVQNFAINEEWHETG